MPALLPRWGPREYAELFAAGSLAFLTLDVYLAHSVNRFANPAEWIPVVASAFGTTFLVAPLLFPNIAVLAGLGLWAMARSLPDR